MPRPELCDCGEMCVPNKRVAAYDDGGTETATRIERAILAVLEREDVSLVHVAQLAALNSDYDECALARAIEAALLECRKGRTDV